MALPIIAQEEDLYLSGACLRNNQIDSGLSGLSSVSFGLAKLSCHLLPDEGDLWLHLTFSIDCLPRLQKMPNIGWAALYAIKIHINKVYVGGGPKPPVRVMSTSRTYYVESFSSDTTFSVFVL